MIEFMTLEQFKAYRGGKLGLLDETARSLKRAGDEVAYAKLVLRMLEATIASSVAAIVAREKEAPDGTDK